jgi:hypothetical protein
MVHAGMMGRAGPEHEASLYISLLFIVLSVNSTKIQDRVGVSALGPSSEVPGGWIRFVEKYKFLGSIFTNDLKVDEEI